MMKKISLLKALDLLLRHQIQVLTLLTEAFSVTLFCLNVGMLGCLVTDATLLCWTALGVGGSALCSLGLMDYLLWVGSLKWSHREAGLWAIIDPFCPQSRLLLRFVVTHYQIFQGCQLCFCLYHVATELLQNSFDSGWSAPPPRR
jgi:hypothetical protein